MAECINSETGREIEHIMLSLFLPELKYFLQNFQWPARV